MHEAVSSAPPHAYTSGGLNISSEQQPADMRAPEVGPRPELPRTVEIKPVNHGYIVTIGCQTFAIEKSETLLAHLSAYLKDPSGVSTLWMTGQYKI